MKKLLQKLFFYRQHPDTALRYLPIVKLLKKHHLSKSSILEIGSGSYGITPYLKKPITGVDVDFMEPEHPLLKQIKGSAFQLPFKNKFFATTIMSDVLEHLPAKKRELALHEAIRVTRHALIISGPFGSKAFEHDKLLASLSQKKTKTIHPYFKDHLEYGLPEEKDINQALGSQGRVKKITRIGTFTNLWIRTLIMKLFISRSRLNYYLYLKGLMPLIFLLKRLNFGPTYRTLFLVELKKWQAFQKPLSSA